MLAGMDTTANTLARILELLATHPDVQEKLRAEIVQAAESVGSAPDFDTLMGLPYLEAVCRETLRLCAFYVLSAFHSPDTRTLSQISRCYCPIPRVSPSAHLTPA